MSAATISRMKAKAKIAHAKAKIAHDIKTNELLGSSIQRDLITKLSPAELQQWIDEHQTNMLEISDGDRERGRETRLKHRKEALDILDAKIVKKNVNTRKNKRKNERKKAKKSKRASATPEPTPATPEPTPATPEPTSAIPEPTSAISPTTEPTPLQSVQQQTIPPQPHTMFFNTNHRINPFIFTDITAPTIRVPISNIVVVSAPSGFLERVTNEQLYDSFEKISKPVQGESPDPLYLIQRQSRDRVLIAFKLHRLAQHLLTKCREDCYITLDGRDIKFSVIPWSQTVEHQTYINSTTHRGGRTRKHIKTKRKTRRTKRKTRRTKRRTKRKKKRKTKRRTKRTKRKTKRRTKRKTKKRRTRKKRGRGPLFSRPAKVAAIGALALGSGAAVSPAAKQTYQEIMQADCNAPFRQMVMPHHPDKGGTDEDFIFVESARQSRKGDCGTRQSTSTEETPKKETPKKEKPPPGKSGKRWRREQNKQRRDTREEARKQSERQEEADRKAGERAQEDTTSYGDLAGKVGATAAALGALEYARRHAGPGYGPNNPRPQRPRTPPRNR